jgi:hypothetical protein
MSNPSPTSEWTIPKERNPKTHAKFKRESFWQITFPMLIVVLVLVGMIAVLILQTGGSGVSVVSDYALILFFIPIFIIGLLAVALNIWLIALILKAFNLIPPYTYIAQKGLLDVQGKVETVSKSITGFIISIQAFFGSIGQFIKEHGIDLEAIMARGKTPDSETE